MDEGAQEAAAHGEVAGGEEVAEVAATPARLETPWSGDP
jgi:hypothetical protein